MSERDFHLLGSKLTLVSRAGDHDDLCDQDICSELGTAATGGNFCDGDEGCDGSACDESSCDGGSGCEINVKECH